MIQLPKLDERSTRFPDPRTAMREPNGLLAIGGDLTPERLLAAYAQGIFPWFGADEPILWWSPDPRCVFRTETLRADRSLRRQWRGKHWRLTADRAFRAVMEGCAAPRHGETGTWIVPEMIDAYCRLHALGHAHSIEAWDGGRLVGGVYGVAVGRLFCGESMFSAESGGSKTALMGLADLLRGWGYPLLDSQVANAHTLGLGAIEIPRATYLHEIARLVALPGRVGTWTADEARLIQPCAREHG